MAERCQGKSGLLSPAQPISGLFPMTDIFIA